MSTRQQRSIVLSSVLLTVLLWTGTGRAQNSRQLEKVRHLMVEQFVVDAGVKNQAVIEAIRKVPRHLFVPAPQQKLAYHDMALPIGHGQTISPPYIVATMTAKLNPRPTDRVLEIGTGSGYQAAVLSHVVKEVFSIEIVKPLGVQAARNLRRLAYKNVKTKIGDGFQGWPQYAPFDKIIVTCSPEKVPPALAGQLREGGLMVIPLGKRYQQSLCLLKKTKGKMLIVDREPTFFVPMTGRAEELRRVEASDGTPELINGSFEDAGDDKKPIGWYYIRQAKVSEDVAAPSGKHVLAFANETPGLPAQVLQAVGADFEKHKYFDFSVWVRTKNVNPGRDREELPKIQLTFFDEKRKVVGIQRLGPWYGTTDWIEENARWPVPPKSRLAVLTVSMYGATGEMAIDQITIRPGKK